MNRRTGDQKTNPTFQRLLGSRAPSLFVGRDDELRGLTAALTLAAKGQGSTIFMSGEPGIGKTRLAREVVALAKGQGFTALAGRAFPLQAGLAYAPFLDAFVPLLRNLDPARLTFLTSDLPSLGRLFEGIRLPPPSSPLEVIGNPALEKARLFEAVSSLIVRLSREAPVVILIDDLQWADATSVELLHYLACGLSDQPVLLLATYCAEAVGNPRRHRSLVVSLRRNLLAEEIVVRRLGVDEVVDLARSILGEEPPDDLLSLLHARAGGVPLFVASMVGGLIDSGNLVHTAHGWVLDSNGETTLPSRIRNAVSEQLDRLAATDRHVLDLIAIMGGTTLYTALQSICDMEVKTLLKALRRLRARGLIDERAVREDVSYSIINPLIQEVVHSEIPEIEQLQSHHLDKRSLESIPDRRQVEIRRIDNPLPAIVFDGCKPAEPGTNDESLTHGLPWLLEQLGEAWERVGEQAPAIAAWSEALAEQGRTGSTVGRTESIARLHRRLALVEWERGNFEAANAHLSACSAPAVGLIPEDQEAGDLNLLRYSLPNQFRNSSNPAELVVELLSVARRMASPRAEAEANLVASIFGLEQGDIVTARDRASRALQLGKVLSEGADMAVCRRAHSILVLIGMRVGDHRDMAHHASLGMAEAQRSGTPLPDVYHRVRLAMATFMAGSWDEALRLSMEAIAAGRRIGQSRYLADALAGRAMILVFHGDSSEAEACLVEAKMVLASGLPLDRLIYSLVAIAEATLALERGQAERALGIARGFTLPPTSWEAAPAGVTAGSKPMSLMLLAEAQVAVGDPQAALDTAREISRLRPTDTPYLVALASRAEGLALQALCQRESAADYLARAHDAFTAAQMPFEAARALLEQAVAMSLAQPAAASTAAHSSLSVFDNLGAQRYADRARRLLRSLGISPPPPSRLPITGGLLSGRELQVAHLVAQGLPTAKIAERLVVSPRTVTTYLDRIYSRLGIGSRTSLVRYMAEAGLLSPEKDNS